MAACSLVFWSHCEYCPRPASLLCSGAAEFPYPHGSNDYASIWLRSDRSVVSTHSCTLLHRGALGRGHCNRWTVKLHRWCVGCSVHAYLDREHERRLVVGAEDAGIFVCASLCAQCFVLLDSCHAGRG